MASLVKPTRKGLEAIRFEVGEVENLVVAQVTIFITIMSRTHAQEKADLPLGVPDMSSGNQLSAAKDRGMIQDIFIPNIQEDPTSLLNSKGFSSVEIDKDSKSPLKNESPSGDRIDDLANIFQQEFT
ncbi:hypothetical protein LWI28_003036 [Acer negundo]|uniref:Uncharacterized protein n=1 Tax=Acer negundo TaxID=4023 RepID=A0AAD5IX92_ACENE|nr:hypothetical protein LWI28_003036 [Acer negundo]